MKPKLIYLIILSACGFSSSAQITGSDTVCAGMIYNYTANIPGSVTYTWTVPANWYYMVGQGTTQISIRPNVNAGQICAEGFDSIGTSMGTQCMTTVLGSSGGGNWTLWPTGNNTICDNIQQVNITPTITFNGGGGCPSSCGSGSSNPNVIWAIYSGLNFIGVIGSQITVGVGTYYAACVDTTLGRNFPQAVQITGGCGGGNGTFSIGQIGLWAPSVSQFPYPVCVGDTVTLEGCCGGWDPMWGGPWSINSGLNPITTFWSTQIQAIVTSVNASVHYSTAVQIQGGFSDGTYCSASTLYNVNAILCNTITSFQTAATTICENSCIDFTNLSQHATSYQWSFPGAIPSASVDTNPSNICYSSPGTYDVMLISSNALYSDTLFLPGYITVTSTPQTSFTVSQTNFCPPDCIYCMNTSTNATSYQWSFPGAIPALDTSANPQNICYNSSGLFNVTLISSNAGCSDSLNVTGIIAVNPAPLSSIQANPVSLCPGTCTSFSNTSIDATSCLWNFPGATMDTSTLMNPANVCYNTPGQYDVLLINYNGLCYDTLYSQGYITVYPQPAPPSVTQNNDSLIAQLGYDSYRWYFNGNLIPGATDYFYVATQNGDYNLIATDSNGCEVEAVIYNVITGVSSIYKSGEQISIYPNPVDKSLFIVKPDNVNECTISIYSQLGKRMPDNSFFSEHRNTIELDVADWPAGLYYLQIVSPDKIFSATFTRQ